VTALSTTPYRQRPERAVQVAAGVGAAAIVTAFAVTPALSTSGPTLCPMRLITGLPCPGCGLTRSWTAAAHGHFADAFSYNLFGPISLIAVAAFVGAVAVLQLRRRPTTPVVRFLRHRLVAAVVALWILYALARAIDGIAGSGIFPDVA
jgi:Protein of unknown function (DUF2752)